MTSTDRIIQAPIIDDRRLKAQAELLKRYIRALKVIPDGVDFEYVTHEYESRSGEPTMVRVDIRAFNSYAMSGNEELSFEFTLEELREFQERGVAGFPLGRASMGKPTDLPVPPGQPTATAPIQQVDWSNRREVVFAIAVELENEARRYVSRQTYEGAYRLDCRCINNRGDHLCGHLQFVYSSAWDRGMLYDEAGAGNRRRILLPIGMGQISIELQAVILEDDSRSSGDRRTGDILIQDYADRNGPLNKLAQATSAFPSEVNHITLMPGEGSIKAIRYIENLLRGTEAYAKLSTADMTQPYQVADTICRRQHRGETSRRLVTQLVAGLRYNNEHRENWMLACAYTILVNGLCLPCNAATTGSANIPTM